MKSWKLFVVALGCLVLVPAGAAAQSAIAGQVTDNTGGVLPGVTVEATSPVLIEQARVVISDGAGQYNIVNLRPGTYSVSFTLPGFGTQLREELELPADFTATVDVTMTVGAVAETVTVSGESPVVDVQQVQRLEVLTREVQDSLPTGRNMWSYAALIPGLKISKPDVGGTSIGQQAVMYGLGAEWTDTTVEIDGLLVTNFSNDGAWQIYSNPMMTAETSYTTTGIGAETQLGGVRLNLIPAEGGNQFSGMLYAGRNPGQWQSDNWNTRLGDLGVPEQDGIQRVELIYDVNASIGGPIRRDKLWFFSAFRRGVNINKVLGSTTRAGDPGVDSNSITGFLTRLTYQMDTRNKISVMLDKTRKRRFSVHGAGDDVDTAAELWDTPHYDVATAKWTSAVSSRMLVEFGWSLNYQDWKPGYQPGIGRPFPDPLNTCLNTPCFPAVGSAAALQQMDQDGWYGVVNHDDNWLGLEYEAAEFPNDHYPHRWNIAGSVSYVTGSHNFKFGFNNTWGNQRDGIGGNGNLFQSYAAFPDPFGRVLDFIGPNHFAATANVAAGLPPGMTGTADSVTVYNDPSNARSDLRYDVGVYAQDSWTLDRLTLNYGLRIDTGQPWVPAVGKPAGRFAPAIDYPEYPLPKFGPDLAPRLSAAYDLFGNAKTALKVGYNRYVEAIAGIIGFRYAPANHASDIRDWFDQHLVADGSNVSGLDPYGTNGDDIAQDWEIGPSGNVNFGLRQTDRPDPNLQRMYNDMFTVGVQQEIMSGVSLNVEWRRREFYRSVSGDNLLRSFDMFTSSVDILRPAPYVGSITVFNIDPANRTTVDEVDRNRGDGFIRRYTGVEVSSNIRLPGGGTILGGWTVERQLNDDCQDERDRGDNPNSLRFCDEFAYPRPFLHQFKLSGNLPFEAPGIGALNVGVSLVSYAGTGGWADAGAGEQWNISRNASLQADQAPQATYGAPWYTEANCVAPCVLGGNYIDRDTYPVINTSTGSTTLQVLPRLSAKFLPTWTQLDVNIAKVINIGERRYDLRVEVYNALNGRNELNHGGDQGTSLAAQQLTRFERATTMLEGRIYRLTASVRF